MTRNPPLAAAGGRPASRRGWAWLVALLPLIAAGSALRLVPLPWQIPADDEWHALHALLRWDYTEIATRFGHADHSIPLTLLYRWLAETIGLSELWMRAPIAVGGLATLALVPWTLRRELGSAAAWVLAAWLALSPLAIYFSMTARPYGLTLPASLLALIAFWRWWRGGGRVPALAYVAATALAAWLHPVSLAFAGAPLLYAAAQAAIGLRHRQFRPVGRLAALGAGLAVGLALTLGPPLWQDFGSLAGKTAEHSVSAASFYATLTLWLGTAQPLAVALLLALVAMGWYSALRRAPRWTVYLTATAMVPSVAIVLMGPPWIHHPLVLARYCLPVIAIVGIWIAEAVTGAGAWLVTPGSDRRAAAVAAGLVGLAALGPLPKLAYYPNQFMGHLRFFADFRDAHNPYATELRPARIPGFYHWLGRQPAGSLTVIEAPWRFEWAANPLNFYQAVHRQWIRIGFVTGLCGPVARGEYPPRAPGMRFRHFVHLSELIRQPQPAGDYIVLHVDRPWPPQAERPELERCASALRRRFGPPVYAESSVRVFDLDRASDGPSDGASNGAHDTGSS